MPLTSSSVVVGLRVAVIHDSVTHLGKVLQVKRLARPKNPVYLVEYLNCRGEPVHVWKHAADILSVKELLPEENVK